MGANAQTSVPAFTSGQVLTAAQVNDINTGIPVFASSTERDAAFGGTGEKTLAEGQMAYLEDTNVTQYYDGSTWAAVGAAGLAPIATATVSAAASVSFDNCFSATYDSYLVLSKNLVGSSASPLDLYFRERNGGSDITTAGYAWSGYFSATAGGNRMYAVAQAFTMVGTVANTSSGFVLNVSNPFTSSQGTTFSLAVAWGSTSANSIFANSLLPSASAVDGFTLYPSSGTITGTITVYGYVKA